LIIVGWQQTGPRARLAAELLVVRMITVGSLHDKRTIGEEPAVRAVWMDVQACITTTKNEGFNKSTIIFFLIV